MESKLRLTQRSLAGTSAELGTICHSLIIFLAYFEKCLMIADEEDVSKFD